MIGIAVFSATGNTYRCAVYLKEKLEAQGEQVSLFRIERGIEIPEEIPEVLVIAYPIHGFNAPYNVMNFVRNLPSFKGEQRGAEGQKGENAPKVYFLKSSGEPLSLNDRSSFAPARILAKKGYEIMGEFHYVMPYNMIFRHSDAMAAKMFAAAKKRMDKDSFAISKREKREMRSGAASKIACGVCKIERWGMRFNGRFFKVKKDKCVACMKCVKNCPVGNISYEDGKFRFGGKCVGCMRCSFLCPTDAFRIGLMNFMRVNGAYDFSADPEKAAIGKYCRKAYEKYFRETEEKYGEKGKSPVEVVAAFIKDGDRFMICRRPEGKARAGLWEFVGGKAEAGETLEQALERECREEIGVSVRVGNVFTETLYDYPDISVHLTIFYATIESGTPRSMENNAIAWIEPSEIPNYSFCPADIPIMKRIMEEGMG